jgi:diketogulonate reductase-like aldo/keto reductase
MAIPRIQLPDKSYMPGIGFGLWQIKDKLDCIESVHDALEAGYRHFDTAQIYGNEQYLGEALEIAGLPRQRLFITTKISIRNFIKVESSFETSLKKLKVDYVNLLLLHYPLTGLRKGAWKKLESIKRQGGARNIGVSNYTIRHLEQMQSYAHELPAVNQVELHVFLQQPELLEYCRKHNIIVQAYSPLAHGVNMDDPVLAGVAKKHDKTPAQIMLRWCVEQGTVPLPKSVHRDRILENIAIFDFEFDQTDLRQLAGLNRDLRTCWDPTKTP